MRSKTCVITASGKRACGTRVASPSGAARQTSANRAIVNALEQIRTEEVRLDDEFVNFGLTIESDHDSNGATLRVDKGNYRATLRYSLGSDPAWKLVVEEQYSGPNYSNRCHYEERFDLPSKAFAGLRRQIGL